MTFSLAHESFLAFLLAEEEDAMNTARDALQHYKQNKIDSSKPPKRPNSCDADPHQCYDGNEMIVKTEEPEVRKRKKYCRSAEEYLSKGGMVAFYDLTDFHSHFGMTRSQVEELITELRPHYRYERGSKLPLENVVLASLWVLASQESYRAIAERFQTSKSVVCTSLHHFCNLVSENLESRITWPNGASMRDTVCGFNIAGFPGTVGAIDACHVAISKPKDVEELEAYMNDKNVFCTTLLAVCDDKYRFTYVNVGHPGTLEDAEVFRRCELYEAFMDDPYSLLPLEFHLEDVVDTYHIIGDAGFPLSEYVMTPYENKGYLTPRQAEYNRRHMSAMMAVTKAIGLLKGRFHRLRLLLMQHLAQCSVAIKACCILHNICIESGDAEMVDIDEDDLPPPPQTPVDQEESPEGKRNGKPLLHHSCSARLLVSGRWWQPPSPYLM